MPNYSKKQREQWRAIRHFKYQVIAERKDERDGDCPNDENRILRKWAIKSWYEELADTPMPDKAVFFKNRMRMFIIRNCPNYKQRILLGKGAR